MSNEDPITSSSSFGPPSMGKYRNSCTHRTSDWSVRKSFDQNLPVTHLLQTNSQMAAIVPTRFLFVLAPLSLLAPTSIDLQFGELKKESFEINKTENVDKSK